MTKYILDMFKFRRKIFDEARLTPLEKTALEHTDVKISDEEPSPFLHRISQYKFDVVVKGDWTTWSNTPEMPSGNEYQVLENKLDETAKMGLRYFALKQRHEAKAKLIGKPKVTNLRKMIQRDKNFVIDDIGAHPIAKVFKGTIQYRHRPYIIATVMASGYGPNSPYDMLN